MASNNQPLELLLLNYWAPEYAAKLGTTLSSFVLMVLCWLLLSRRPTSHRLQQHVSQLDSKAKDAASKPSISVEKSELATRVISHVHAIVVSYGAAVFLYRVFVLGERWDGTGERPQAYQIMDFYVSFSIAYFIGDTMMCIVLYENYGPGFLFHAICGLICFSWAMMRQLSENHSQLWCGGVLIWELSTPFLNNIFFLKTYFPHWKVLPVLNGILLVIVFFVGRICIGFPVTYDIITQAMPLYEQHHISFGEAVLISVFAFLMSVLNVFWLYKLVYGILRKLRRADKSAKKAE
eukprot:m.784374 g.784374  ORF g.784374 m.784374 type:complete len:293 (+) comp23298_c3_seq5:140-1018(+)